MGNEGNALTLTIAQQTSANYGAGSNSYRVGGNVGGNLTVASVDKEVAAEMASLSRDVGLGALTVGRDVSLGALGLVGGYGALMGDVIHSQANSGVEMAKLQENVLMGSMNQNRQLFESTVDRLGTLSETKLTDGASNMQRSLLIGFGLLVAGVIAFFIWGRK